MSNIFNVRVTNLETATIEEIDQLIDDLKEKLTQMALDELKDFAFSISRCDLSNEDHDHDPRETNSTNNPEADGDGGVEKASVKTVEELSDLFMSMMRGETSSDPSITVQPHPHYNNDNGSLYKIASDLNLNAYEFDILKRIARCRKKGQFKEDLQKIKDTVDLYLKEHKQ